MDFLIFSFASTHAALHAQKILNVAGIPYAVMPTPREITADCGIALRIEPAWIDRSIAIMTPMQGVSGGYRIHKAIVEGGLITIHSLDR